MIFGITNWSRTIPSKSSQRDIASGKTPNSVSFSTPVDAAILATAKSYNDRIAMHNLFSTLLKTELSASSPKAASRQIAPNFFCYVEGGYKIFQNAARALSQGAMPGPKTKAASYLLDELRKHGEMLCTGQILFHGQEDIPLITTDSHPAFISTSLNPGVAVTHAIRNSDKVRGVVYVIRLESSIRALWHHDAESSAEYEFLLPAGLAIEVGQPHAGGAVDVVEIKVSTKLSDPTTATHPSNSTSES